MNDGEGVLKGWQPDPFGIHEFRFFSNDGKPTLLVSDGGSKGHDRPPSTGLASPAPAGEPTSETAGRGPGERPPEPAAKGRDPLPRVVSQVDAVVPLTKPFKFAYGVVITAIVVSALALVLLHISGGNKKAPARSSSSPTPSSSTTTTTLPIPTGLQPSAGDAATALVSSWASGNRAAALSVATPPAVSALFAARYSSGLAIDRGCSDAFSPIVCTYGPPGGASPTDPIYEIFVTQTPKGWYVSSTKIEN